jgi:hypothetical protein
MRPLRLAGWLGLAPALLLLAWASVAVSPPARENSRAAVDGLESKIDSPRLFGGSLLDAGHEATSLPEVFSGLPGQTRGSLAAQVRNKMGGVPLPAQQAQPGLRGVCEVSGSDLCYDLADRRIIYRPARQYMPKLDGFTAENVSVRRDGIRFRYSFK